MALAKPAFNTNQSLIRHVITYMGMTGMPFAMDVASVVPVAVNAGQYSKRKLGEILDADAAPTVAFPCRFRKPTPACMLAKSMHHLQSWFEIGCGHRLSQSATTLHSGRCASCSLRRS